MQYRDCCTNGLPGTPNTMITVLVYNKKTGETRTGGQELLDSWTRDPDTLIWVDLHGNTENFDKTVMQEKFGLHPLAIQDALRDRHPPKIEAFDEYTFILLKGLSEFTEDFEFSTIQLAIFIGKEMLEWLAVPGLSAMKPLIR